jgi:hypothetical protein
MRRLIAMLLTEVMGVTTTYWMREGGGKVVVCASRRTGPGVEAEQARTLERQAERLVEMMGARPRSKGSMVRRDGRGEAVVTGMVELPWSPRVESELEHMGLVEVK